MLNSDDSQLSKPNNNMRYYQISLLSPGNEPGGVADSLNIIQVSSAWNTQSRYGAQLL